MATRKKAKPGKNGKAKARKRERPGATWAEVFAWLEAGKFYVDGDGRVFTAGGRELAVRINTRRGMDDGDPRVDLCVGNQRQSCHVSRLVWMANIGCVVPPEFEIHHIDGNPRNNRFDNLLCVHAIDHLKLHCPVVDDDGEEVPF